MLNNFPSPRALDQERMADLLTTRALIVHRFWYGFIPTIGIIFEGASGFIELPNREAAFEVGWT